MAQDAAQMAAKKVERHEGSKAPRDAQGHPVKHGLLHSLTRAPRQK